MATEQALTQIIPKPWGIADLRPWSHARSNGKSLGEIRYERSDRTAADPSLLLKLLFTNEPLSIQVHPNDAFAHSIGQPRGKSEAWYVLSAAPDAKIAVGLKQKLTSRQLREASNDGSISDLVEWRRASAGDAIFVPAGTIHAIGAGLVIAEIQQRSNATFRLFDYGRQRELQIDSAIAAANTEPVDFLARPNQLTNERTLLVSNQYFAFERITLPPNSAWSLAAERETWLLVVGGSAHIGPFDVSVGGAIFAQSDRVAVRTGANGMTALAAYTGGNPILNLLQSASQPGAINSDRSIDVKVSASSPQGTAVPVNRRSEVAK